jgi:hypothetical protein
MEKMFQLRFNLGGGSGSYAYATATPDKAVEASTEAANAWLRRYRTPSAISMWRRRPPRVCHVVEYDKGRGQAQAHGLRFKLRLAFIEFRFTDGSTSRDEWYTAA